MSWQTAVFGKDNLLDDINAEATGILADYIREHPETAHTCVDLVSVFRKLERSGDHITNIAEEIVFFIDAKVLKHSGKRRRKLSENRNFLRVFKQKLGLLRKLVLYLSPVTDKLRAILLQMIINPKIFQKDVI